MRKSEVAYTFEMILIVILFFSILVLMLNSFLPTVILKNPDNLVYFNIESMQYSQNIDIQNLYNDINLINNLIWITIIFTFIAFFGVIINISKIYKKISYLFLSVGCLSIIFSTILIYLYINFILKVNNFNNIILAYIIIEPIRYSYIIVILLMVIVLISISYIIMTIPILFRAFKDVKSNKQELTKEKPVTNFFPKNYDQKISFYNRKQENGEDFNYENKKEFTESELANEINRIETKENLDTIHINKEPMDEKITTDEKKSPFLENYIREKPKQKKDETNEVKISELFEKALSLAIDKKKKEELKQRIVKKPVEPEKKDIRESIKNKENKKYPVKCPECSFIFIKENNEESITKIKCPRCGKEGTIK